MNPIQRLEHILSWRRPAKSESENRFVDWLRCQLPDHHQDAYGNVHVELGQSNTLFSCHTDTMCRDRPESKQVIGHRDGIYHLSEERPGDCLGADDGAGIWLMIEMIRASVPGYYIFHREEEIGGRGSQWLADHRVPLFRLFDRAIAFDRRGLGDVITHQAGSRCCSDEFATALAEQLGFPYKPCDRGIFTDTANFTSLVAECTNISVGYEHEHGPFETLDSNHLWVLLTTLIAVDWENLPTVRDPSAAKERDWMLFDNKKPTRTLEDAIIDRRADLAIYFRESGINDGEDLDLMLTEFLWDEQYEESA